MVAIVSWNVRETVTKFNEAVYFLKQMESNSNNTAIFSRNLNAFLSSARSITYVMQKELSPDPDFESWYKEKQEQMNNDVDFKFFNELRVDSIHKKSINPRIKIMVKNSPDADRTTTIPLGTVSFSEGGEMIFHDPGAEGFVKRNGRISYAFDGKGNDDVVDSCEKYLTKIQDIMTEWENRCKPKQS